MSATRISAVLLAVVLSACWPGQNDKPVSSTICQLVSSPTDFTDRTVRVDAYVESDGMEWVLLKDDRCAARQINLDYSDTAAESTNAKRIKEAIFYMRPFGTAYKDIRARFVGRFQWRPESDDLHRKLVLVVSSIDNLRISRRTRKRESPFPELR